MSDILTWQDRIDIIREYIPEGYGDIVHVEAIEKMFESADVVYTIQSNFMGMNPAFVYTGKNFDKAVKFYQDFVKTFPMLPARLVETVQMTCVRLSTDKNEKRCGDD